MRDYNRMSCSVLEELDRAYIAGLMDGEGCISITRRQRKEVSTLQYSLVVRISNTDVKLINYLLKVVGGGCIETVREKNCFSWSVTGRAASEFLSQILPYLQSREEEAELAILFQSRRGTQGRHKTVLENEVDQIMYERCRYIKSERGSHNMERGGVLS